MLQYAKVMLENISRVPADGLNFIRNCFVLAQSYTPLQPHYIKYMWAEVVCQGQQHTMLCKKHTCQPQFLNMQDKNHEIAGFWDKFAGQTVQLVTFSHACYYLVVPRPALYSKIYLRATVGLGARLI